jgi:photosynthetic reaction center H subunit
MTATFWGNVDLAQVALYLFWIFFFGLVVYLQRENQREGYPLEDDDGATSWPSLFSTPKPKTFILPGGRGEVSYPNDERETRTFAMERVAMSAGSPFEPTGNPMKDGVGPAAYAMRKDEPELDGHGHPKIQPMRNSEAYAHAAGRDPRGMPVVAGDGEIVGEISDMWIDVPEMLVRYLEVDLGGGDTRLIPMPLARITWRGVRVHAIFAEHFADVPKTKSGEAVTKLEEEMICAYYSGGKLYAARDRVESQLDPLTV